MFIHVWLNIREMVKHVVTYFWLFYSISFASFADIQEKSKDHPKYWMAVTSIGIKIS